MGCSSRAGHSKDSWSSWESYTPLENPTERTNRTVKTMIAQFTEGDQRCWDEKWPELMLAMNSGVSDSTGYSPEFVVQRGESRLPRALYDEETIGTGQASKTPDEDARKLKKLYQLVRRNLEKAAQDQARHYNLRRRPWKPQRYGGVPFNGALATEKGRYNLSDYRLDEIPGHRGMPRISLYSGPIGAIGALIEKMTVFGRRNALTRSPQPSAPAKAQGSSMFKPGPDGKEKERPHSDPLELLNNLGTRANELVKRMNDQRHVDNALVFNNFEKLHTRTIGTQTAAKHTGSKRLRESPEMAAEPTKRQRGIKLQQASTQLKPPAQSQDELTPSGTVDHGATPAAKKQLKWHQVGPRVRKKREPREREPRPDAIIIQPQGKLSYSDILRMVTRRQDGKLQEVGDIVNRIRRTAKGELLLELNGASKSNTAKLREDISAALGLQTGIRAVSGELCVEVRDLDSLVEKEDIAAAIAASMDASSVDTSAIKSLRPSFAGTQLAVVCLPPVQARALLMVGKLKVGWFRSQ
ncbi:GL16231 [Drosophila persimilis]|uniref:GL16231 n=1 Tax=Drosophila persimilis TaxID=7234 RepID=B4HBJ4_DROPE|nr:GL16231 [Drosophila persimilis]